MVSMPPLPSFNPNVHTPPLKPLNYAPLNMTATQFSSPLTQMKAFYPTKPSSENSAGSATKQKTFLNTERSTPTKQA